VSNAPAPDEQLDARVACGLRNEALAVIPDYCTAGLWQGLAQEARAQWAKGEFHKAGVGRAARRQVRPELRSDRSQWIDPAEAVGAQRAWLERMEALRARLNRELYLGLFDFEAQLALYPPGAFYATHLDRFQDSSRRVVSTLLYLNDAWQPDHAGLLRLYLERADTEPWRDVEPIGGTFVAFLAAQLPHQVLPATRERWSVAGWFRSRA
jgi:SM-20-related protein